MPDNKQNQMPDKNRPGQQEKQPQREGGAERDRDQSRREPGKY